jgi:hypothetical protein
MQSPSLIGGIRHDHADSQPFGPPFGLIDPIDTLTTATLKVVGCRNLGRAGCVCSKTTRNHTLSGWVTLACGWQQHAVVVMLASSTPRLATIVGLGKSSGCDLWKLHGKCEET